MELEPMSIAASFNVDDVPGALVQLEILGYGPVSP